MATTLPKVSMLPSGTLKLAVLPFFQFNQFDPFNSQTGGWPRVQQKKKWGLEGVISGVIGPSSVHTIEGHSVL
jgi:hypothetical protein